MNRDELLELITEAFRDLEKRGVITDLRIEKVEDKEDE